MIITLNGEATNIEASGLTITDILRHNCVQSITVIPPRRPDLRRKTSN